MDLVSIYKSLSNSHKMKLKQLLIAKDYRRAAKYLKSFKGERSYLYTNPGRSIDQLTKDFRRKKSAILDRTDLREDHVPVFKTKRYFGVEIECFVPSNGGDCHHCDGTGTYTQDCHQCDGSGEETVSCDDCSGEGHTLDSEGEKVDCDTCAGEGTVNTTCYSCEGSGSTSEDCEHCDGTGRLEENYDDLISDLENEGITYATVKGDGSLDSDWSNYQPVEITCLVDFNNMDNLKRLTSYLNKTKAKVNTTCGLHVHLDTRHLGEKERIAAAKALARAMNVMRLCVAPSRLKSTYCKPGMCTSDRYHEVNASGSKSTLEIRLHHGTTDFDKITMWAVALRCVLDNYKRVKNPTTLKELALQAKFPKEVRKYLHGRIVHFQGKDNKVLKAA